MQVLPLAAWQNFYVIIGTAAATLMGLMFVVITLIAGVQVRVSLPRDGVAAFNSPNVVHFCAALVIAALLSMPWQALWHVSLLLGPFGLGAMTYVVIVIRRASRQTYYQPVLEDWLWHMIFPLVAYAALLVAAIVLPSSPVQALFVIGGVELLLLLIGIHNAWDNVTYLVLEHSQAENKSPEK